MAWSPEQISHRLKVDFPDDESMRISPETIYQSLYIQGRGALKRELTACLRTGRALREPRARTGRSGRRFVTDEVMISQRPAEAADRAVPGHWEGDLIIGLEKSAIGTLVERSSRSTMLLHLPRMEGFGTTPTVKNGPALAGHGAEAVRDAITAQIGTLPEQLRRSLTWDQGRRDGPARPAQDRRRHRGLLLRPPLALAATQQREHQRPAAPVLPQGHRPVPMDRRRARRRRRRPQQQTPQDPRLAHTRRGLPATAILTTTGRCCIDPLNLPSTPPAQITTFAAENGITRSMGLTGICWDNAMAESFFATLKTEFYYRRVWPTKDGAKLAVGAWIEDRYNRRRRHSSIGQISPGYSSKRCSASQPWPRKRVSAKRGEPYPIIRLGGLVMCADSIEVVLVRPAPQRIGDPESRTDGPTKARWRVIS